MDVELGGFLNQSDDYDYGDYSYKEEPVPKDVEAVLIPVVYFVVVVVGLLGNALLLAVVVKKWRYWRISDIFVIHLGVADTLLLLTLPFWAVQAAHSSGWCFGTAACKICGAVFNINFYCGIFLLLCISLDRYWAIICSSPLYSQNKPALAHASCLLVWLLSLLLSVPDWMFLEATNDSAQKTLCVHSYENSERLYSRLVHLVVGLLLPAAALIFCLSHVFLRLTGSSKDLWKQKVAMVILPLVVVFFLCWMPYNISLIVDTYRKHSKRSADHALSDRSQQTALMVTSAVACVHACLRPLLYISLCRNFRKLVLAKRICATTKESEKSLWELGVAEEAVSDQNNTKEEQKQMTVVDQQEQSAC